jgi:nucleotide-binding universal stress UspA family protein
VKEISMFKNLLIALDGSELSDKALGAGLDLARSYGSRVTLLTASDPISTGIGSGGFGTLSAGPLVERLEEAYEAGAREILDAALARAAEAGVKADALYAPRQRPADAILQEAEARGCDTILMGSHGRRGLRRLIIGSQANEVLTRATVPVLVVK